MKKGIIIYRSKFQDYQVEVLGLLKDAADKEKKVIKPTWRENVKIENAEEKKRALMFGAVSYTHLRAHETSLHLVCRLLLEKTPPAFS